MRVIFIPPLGWAAHSRGAADTAVVCGCGFIISRMLDNSLAHFEGEIQAGELQIAVFELLDDTQRMEVVVKRCGMRLHEFIQLALAGVAKGRMTDVMDEGESFREFAV